MSNLTKRILSAIVGLALVISILVYGSTWLWKSVILILAIIGFYEFFHNMVKNRFPKYKDLTFIGVIFGALISFMLLFFPESKYLSVIPTFLFLGSSLYFLFYFKSMKTVIERMGYLLIGVLYVSFTLPYIGLIVDYPVLGINGKYLLALIFTITWGNDTFAYTFGRLFGKHKLYEKMSPNKTIEGSIGGILGGIGLAILIKTFLLTNISYIDIILVSILAGALGQMGDLVESMFKRFFEIKDSGVFLPGHGGVLDRFDSVMFNAPFIYFYFLLTNGGIF